MLGGLALGNKMTYLVGNVNPILSLNKYAFICLEQFQNMMMTMPTSGNARATDMA